MCFLNHYLVSLDVILYRNLLFSAPVSLSSTTPAVPMLRMYSYFNLLLLLLVLLLLVYDS